jgi:2-methylcitrate dehydratase PrpD
MVAELARELGGSGGASIFNRDWTGDVSRATLVNGVMMGAFEAEHVAHNAHPSATVFPAALAIAERDGRDGRSFLAAMLLGYEIVCRVGAAQTRATESERGFHNPGVNGGFGAAAAVGKLLGLDAERLAWALGIAGSHACGLTEFVWEGAMTKRATPGVPPSSASKAPCSRHAASPVRLPSSKAATATSTPTPRRPDRSGWSSGSARSGWPTAW